MMFMYTLLLVSAGVALLLKAVPLYGWLCRCEMTYAAHWNEREKVALNAFEYALRFDKRPLSTWCDYDEIGDNVEPDTLSGMIAIDVFTTPKVRQYNDSLRALLLQPVEDFESAIAQKASLPCLAAEMGQLAAMQVFVERGASPTSKNEHGESLLALVLQNWKGLPTENVLAMGDWLLSHGADLHDCKELLSSAILADDSEATLEWLLARGLPINSEELPLLECVVSGSALSVFERLAKEGRINVNARGGEYTYLQQAVFGWADVKSIETLLKLGAQPDLLPEKKNKDGSNQQTPLQIVLKQLAEKESVEYTQHLFDVLQLLLAHGAAPQLLPPRWACPELLEQTRRTYQEIGAVAQQEPSTSESL